VRFRLVHFLHLLRPLLSLLLPLVHIACLRLVLLFLYVLFDFHNWCNPNFVVVYLASVYLVVVDVGIVDYLVFVGFPFVVVVLVGSTLFLAMFLLLLVLVILLPFFRAFFKAVLYT